MASWSKASLYGKAKIAERNKKWRRANPEKVRRTHRNKWLKKKYGITLEGWETLFSQQGGRCASCGTNDPERNGRNGWCTDHDHRREDLHVRAILCNTCNAIAGYSKDNAARLRLVADWLDRVLLTTP